MHYFYIDLYIKLRKQLAKHLNGSVSLNITQFKCVFFCFLFFFLVVGGGEFFG